MSDTRTFVLGLDYEIFFGKASGDYQKCLIEPTDALMRVAEKTGLKVTYFVDTGYLAKLKELADRHTELANAYSDICRSLKKFVEAGHELQLHLHPHWSRTTYSDDGWRFHYDEYRLQSLPEDEVDDLVASQTRLLADLADAPITAYRAGGWCLQPFDRIGKSLKSSGVLIDSTVFRGGYNPEENRYFDFRDAPREPFWRFSSDPIVRDDEGDFLEIPISATNIPASFFWKMAIARRVGSTDTGTFGDGEPLNNGAGYYLRRLTLGTLSPVSIDGLKGSLLERSYAAFSRQHREGAFNVMGHPKSLSRNSLASLEDFLGGHTSLERTTLSGAAQSITS